MVSWLALAGTFLAAVAACVGALIAARASRAAASQTADAAVEVARTAPYEHLSQRVSQLEPLVGRVELLEREQRVDRIWILTTMRIVRQHDPALAARLPRPEWYDGDVESAL